MRMEKRWMVDSVAPGRDVRKDELMQARPFFSESSLFSPSYVTV